MSATSDHLNQDRLKKLAARENLTFLGLTLPYLLMVALLIVIPVGWLFYLSFIGRDGHQPLLYADFHNNLQN
jgi:putative spermidine/putrescine transport system permease protein/spermidine/putrescine transport system permease protein